MTDQQLLKVLMRSPVEAKPCTRLGADWLEWLRPAASQLADRPMAVREEMRARRMCAGCPVRNECLELSLRGGPVEGVQGGATERSRQTLRHRRQSPNSEITMVRGNTCIATIHSGHSSGGPGGRVPAAGGVGRG